MLKQELEIIVTRKPCIIVDIDGTLSDLTHRLHFIHQDKKNWDSFFANVLYDTAHNHIVDIVKVLGKSYHIILCSGRPERCRADTLFWLKDNAVVFDELYMRKDGDHREDYLVKQELLEEIMIDYTPVAAIDDRKQVVDMWRSNGVPCLQCADGDF